MSVLPGVTGKPLVAALRKAGFDVVRIKGSHHFLRHADGRTTVVPVHAGETIGPGLMSKFSATAMSIVTSCRSSCSQLVKYGFINGK